MLGALVSTKLKRIKLIVLGKITLVPVAFLMALSIVPASEVSHATLFMKIHVVKTFSKNKNKSSTNTLIVPNSLDSDQARHFVHCTII